MRRDELPQKSELFAVEGLPAVTPRFRHNRSMPEKKSERKHFFQLTFRHTGAAAKSGLPAANNNCA